MRVVRDWKCVLAAIAIVLLVTVVGYVLKYLFWASILKGVSGL